jgi:hypothetical protein
MKITAPRRTPPWLSQRDWQGVAPCTVCVFPLDQTASGKPASVTKPLRSGSATQTGFLIVPALTRRTMVFAGHHSLCSGSGREPAIKQAPFLSEGIFIRGNLDER